MALATLAVATPPPGNVPAQVVSCVTLLYSSVPIDFQCFNVSPYLNSLPAVSLQATMYLPIRPTHSRQDCVIRLRPTGWT